MHGDGHDGLGVIHERAGAVLDDRALLHELIHRERACEASGASGGKRMVRPCHIVPHRFRRPGTQEDGTCIAYLTQMVHGIPHVQLEMLWRDHIHRLHGLVHIIDDDDEPMILEGGAGDVRARRMRKVLLDRMLHLIRIGARRTDQIACRHGVMLCLRHEVDGHERGVSRAIGHHAYL